MKWSLNQFDFSAKILVHLKSSILQDDNISQVGFIIDYA